jgi:zinc and cadmium transporter
MSAALAIFGHAGGCLEARLTTPAHPLVGASASRSAFVWSRGWLRSTAAGARGASMTTLGWITLGGVAMSLIALSGSLTLLLPEDLFDRVVPPLVALAAGTLIGGALLHMLPEAVEAMGNDLSVYLWLVGGFVGFFVLEQFLHWHHCHRPVAKHGPLGYLILVADGVHNFIGGLAVAGAFLVDIRVGLVTWVAAAAHEVPQELGDFGILVRAGWSRARALVFNVVSALTFLIGGWVAYAVSGRLEVTWLLPFAAGNFLYIAAADLIPELTEYPDAPRKAQLTGMFVLGLGILLVVALLV